MARLKCEYCGEYISETDKRCPNCGANNANYKRVTNDTPKTIEQLQGWYKARNLPPEEVTRFFIGKNIHEPRVFGIYEENGKFIVYKNKADGSRAIRYEGTDEAYAVNELYLRLKSEILNQKSMNLNRNRRNHHDSVQNQRANTKIARKVLIKMFLMIVICSFLTNVILMIPSLYLSYKYGTNVPHYYLSETKEIYYKASQKEWWEFNKSNNEWYSYAEINDGKIAPNKNDIEDYELSDLVRMTGIDEKTLSIQNSRKFIDAGHHEKPKSSYYSIDDKIYYFLDDKHSSYGNKNNTGWYTFDDTTDEWIFYSNNEDKSYLGDELYYTPDNYYIGDSLRDSEAIYDYDFSWVTTNFEDTGYYESYQANEKAYSDYLSSSSYDDDDDDDDYSYDNDYDWDSGSSWDSGGTDWGSDW